MIIPLSYRDQLEQDSQVNEVSQYQEEGDGSWPPEPLAITREIRGELADRIRNRLQAPHRRVYIEEETYYGGYSEYTQENNTRFSVICGKHSFSIDPGDAEVSWPDLGGNDSVFAKLQFWLLTGEDPEGVWDDMLEFREIAYAGNLSYEAWVIKPDSILYRLIMGTYGSGKDAVHIAQLSDNNWGLSILKHYQSVGRPTREYKSLRVPSAQSIDKPQTRRLLLQELSDTYAIRTS